MNRIIGLLLVLALCFVFVGCGDDTTATVSKNESSDVASVNSTATTTEQKVLHTENKVGFQLEQPKAGEKAAVLSTNYGDIYIRLFPEIAPKAVQNFIGLIEKGYYNGLIFHRVINNFMIQGGDPTGTGSGGESIWGKGKSFEDEFCSELLNIRYSLAMANSGVNTNGSQFFINQAPASQFSRVDYDAATKKQQMEYYYNQNVQQYGTSFTQYYPTLDSFIEANGGIVPIPDEVLDLYEEKGGNIHLDGAWRTSGGHTVFGQVYQGMDVVDKIAEVETGSNDKPVKDVVIESAKIITVS